MTKTLRIKKIYFDQIASGEKSYEYREKKPYYDRFFSDRIEHLRLHYQGAEKLICEVVNVEVVRNPLPAGSIVKTENVYRVKLGRCVRI